MELDNGNPISISDLKSGRVILFSYPEAFTPGCTNEVCSIRDHFGEIANKGVSVYGISPDPVDKNHNFSKEHNLPYPLISDEGKELLEEFDLYGEKLLYGKTVVGVRRQILFIEEGEVVKVIKGVRTKTAGEQVLKAMKELGWS